MRIGVDIMGGDYAPDATLLGAALARKELPDEIELALLGDEHIIKDIITREGYDLSGFTILHTPHSILMEDHPAKVFTDKPDSGIALGLRMLKRGELDGFASIGNTGAMLVGSIQIINSIPGVIRPSLAIAIPNDRGTPTILLDIGLNPDPRPDVLYQYGIFGSLYAELVHGIVNPKVGLLNIGKEEEKGNLLTRATYQSMKGTKDFNFIGNVEGNDFFRDNGVDVIVCDGFVGNVLVKEMEAFYSMLKRRKIEDEFTDQFNFERYGGTPILGILSTVLIGHGISNGQAVKTLIMHTRDVIESNFIGKIKKKFQ
ncbi:MAG: phosphate acyltransferase [Bacteroidales bacterium]|nr:phosphate acyltransferase [Bacteroidales bacterium]